MKEKLKVLLVDDHEVVRLGLRTLLTNFPHIEIVGECASGYILKEIRTDYLIEMLNAVMQGETVFDSTTLKSVVKDFQNDKNEKELIQRLTATEIHILQLMSAGKTNRDIAHTVHLSEKTIRNYVSSILDKLELHNRTEAAAFAIRNRINESS